MSIQSDYESQEFAKWLQEGNIPIYQEVAGKDIGKYKILGLRKLCFDTEQQAKDFYVENELSNDENMFAEREKLESL